ncbi:MAG: kinase-like domain-containing protein [Monoraphidium minutum]|nr:MAG: kinase-like domain-containing protein [Monoraphidium minutum]
MGNLCSMIDVDLVPRPPPRMHASELAPPVYAAERLQQLHINGSGEAAHKRTSPAARSPERRMAGGMSGAVAGSSDAGAAGLAGGGAFDGIGVPIGGGGDDAGWRISAAGGGAQAVEGSDGDGGAVAHADAEPEPLLPFSWTKGELIGIGAFGRVFTGLNNVTGEIIAVKQVSFARDEALQGRVSEHIRALEAEVEVLRGLKHENIVQYLGTERTSDSMYIFLEYVHGGSIASLLAKFGPFQEAVIRVYTRQILRGLEYLHARGIMHRDIKGANILVDKGSTVKLADFGASKKIENLATIGAGCNSIRGTPYWMAPEVIKQTGHGRPADIWSVGCTVIEMATGKPPWSNYAAPVAAMFQIASSKDPPPIPEHLSPQAKDFLLMCFNRIARDRASATRLLKHPFVAEGPPSQPPPNSFSFATSGTALFAAGPARAATGAAAQAAARASAAVAAQQQQQPSQQQQQQQQAGPRGSAAVLAVQQQAQQQAGGRASPKRPPTGVPQGGERGAGPGSSSLYGARGGDGAAAATAHPSPLRGAQQPGLEQQPAAAGAASYAGKPAGSRPLYSPLSSSRVGHPAMPAHPSGGLAAAPPPLLQQQQAQQQAQASPGPTQQHKPDKQGDQQPQQQATPKSQQAESRDSSPTPQQQHSQAQQQKQKQQQQSHAAQQAQQQQQQAGATPPPPQQQQQQQQPGPRHSVVACQTLIDFNPVEEPSWLPEYVQDGGGGGGGGQLLPPRRRTVYDDPDDGAATAAAAVALAAAQRRPAHRLTEAGNGVAARHSQAAACALAASQAAGAPAPVPQQRPQRRFTEAGNGVAPRPPPPLLQLPQALVAAHTQRSLGGSSSRTSPQPSQHSSSDGCQDQDTAPRGADSPGNLASSPVGLKPSSPVGLKLPRQQLQGGADARRGPLGRGLAAAARARSPHDSFGSSGETLLGGRKAAGAASQLGPSAGGGPDADAPAEMAARAQQLLADAGGGGDDVRASSASQWSNVPLDDADTGGGGGARALACAGDR